MAGQRLSPPAEIVSLRHMPPAQVPALKNSAFDLMTPSAFIARAPAELKQIDDPSRRPETREIRRAIAIRHETEDDDYPGFGAGRRTERRPARPMGAQGEQSPPFADQI